MERGHPGLWYYTLCCPFAYPTPLQHWLCHWQPGSHRLDFNATTSGIKYHNQPRIWSTVSGKRSQLTQNGGHTITFKCVSRHWIRIKCYPEKHRPTVNETLCQGTPRMPRMCAHDAITFYPSSWVSFCHCDFVTPCCSQANKLVYSLKYSYVGSTNHHE